MQQTQRKNTYSVGNYTVETEINEGYGTVEVRNTNNMIVFTATLKLNSADLERKESLLMGMATSALRALENSKPAPAC